MIDNLTVYALIPARGGSKGILHKNIAPLCGKPLIAYTIEQASESKYLDRVIVSTDDKSITDAAKMYNAEVPFLRPSEISTDEASTVSVVLHALNYFKDEEGTLPDVVVLLQPTSPLRTVEDIDKSLEMFVRSEARSLTSVYKSEISPYWFKSINAGGFITDFVPPPVVSVRRQDTDNLYLLNGAIYIFYPKDVLSSKILLGQETLAYIMPIEKSIDVDTMLDLQFAEFLLKGKKVDTDR